MIAMPLSQKYYLSPPAGAVSSPPNDPKLLTPPMSITPPSKEKNNSDEEKERLLNLHRQEREGKSDRLRRNPGNVAILNSPPPISRPSLHPQPHIHPQHQIQLKSQSYAHSPSHSRSQSQSLLHSQPQSQIQYQHESHTLVAPPSSALILSPHYSAWPPQPQQSSSVDPGVHPSQLPFSTQPFYSPRPITTYSTPQYTQHHAQFLPQSQHQSYSAPMYTNAQISPHPYQFPPSEQTPYYPPLTTAAPAVAPRYAQEGAGPLIPFTQGPNSRSKKKTHVKQACLNCKKAHLSCDSSRPCRRCVQNHKTESCQDVEHKKRGRPRLSTSRPLVRDLREPATAVLAPAPSYGTQLPIDRHTMVAAVLPVHSFDPTRHAPVVPHTAGPLTTSFQSALPEPVAAYLSMHLQICKVSEPFKRLFEVNILRKFLSDVLEPVHHSQLQEMQKDFTQEREDLRNPNTLAPIGSAEDFIYDLTFTDIDQFTHGFREKEGVWLFRRDGERKTKIDGIPYTISLGQASSHFFVVLWLRPAVHLIGQENRSSEPNSPFRTMPQHLSTTLPTTADFSTAAGITRGVSYAGTQPQSQHPEFLSMQPHANPARHRQSFPAANTRYQGQYSAPPPPPENYGTASSSQHHQSLVHHQTPSSPTQHHQPLPTPPYPLTSTAPQERRFQSHQSPHSPQLHPPYQPPQHHYPLEQRNHHFQSPPRHVSIPGPTIPPSSAGFTPPRTPATYLGQSQAPSVFHPSATSSRQQQGVRRRPAQILPPPPYQTALSGPNTPNRPGVIGRHWQTGSAYAATPGVAGPLSSDSRSYHNMPQGHSLSLSHACSTNIAMASTGGGTSGAGGTKRRAPDSSEEGVEESATTIGSSHHLGGVTQDALTTQQESSSSGSRKKRLIGIDDLVR